MRRPLFPVTIFFMLLWLVSPLAGNCASQEAQGASLYARTLLEQINTYRIVNELPPLRFDARLNHLAMQHSFAMFYQKRMSHVDFSSRFNRSGSRMCVENIGYEHRTALQQFDAWRHSIGHDTNMLKKGITRAGIAEIGTYVTFFACQ